MVLVSDHILMVSSVMLLAKLGYENERGKMKKEKKKSRKTED